MPERVAAIDCGTNSIRLLVCDVDGESKTDLLREMRIVRLGQGVDTSGRLSPEAIDRTLAATREYAEFIAMLDATAIRFCATSAVRDAANADEFSSAVESVLGVRPEILSGDREARASFDGATRELDGARTLLVDLGGGSTEIVVGEGEDIQFATSLDIGSVRLTERYLPGDPPSVGEMTECMTAIDALVVPIVDRLEPADLFVGVAGTVTTIAAHSLGLGSYDSEAIHGARLHVDDVREACLSLASMSVADRRALPFMHPGRADVIGAGALILDRLIELLPLSTDTLTVSEHDILDGIAWGATTRRGD
ncbi:Ppx/GppA phosphatase family protein [Aeromicrobium piscarium]|uniref:Ppx/GppA family phosphatase n=1 Tax=Aeromicrobium piscarium TaxID=2590901 RepID=A0A554RTT4_9ACTN|nr:Ppx/GppA phosphatase family protein [Aeromicrobium piscarium]TSD57527.1 Ppx/GppA family phosphatase [Aeromicrobium piscarium]